MILASKMIAVEPSRTKWTPLTEEDRNAVLAELETVLSSSHFCNSKRYPAFLRYVVQQTLNGNGDQIKERTLGIEVFGRTPDYDTNADTVVRYTAGEVRKRLSLYYHEAADSPIHIYLSARSYRPEFLRFPEEAPSALLQPTAFLEKQDALFELPMASLPSIDPALGGRTRKILRPLLAVVFIALSFVVARSLWNRSSSEGINRFWSPILQAKGPTLICPGGVVFSPSSDVHTKVADQTVLNPFLSFENGLAMGRVAALLNAKENDYRVQSSASTTLAQIRESPVVLIGAYNNEWTQRLLLPLRFHFNAEPNEQIVDALQPSKYWARDKSKPYSDSPDYALVVRFRNPSTDSFVVVAAGLQRYGTDAASQFIVSPRLLDILNRRIGSDWANKNIEVVLKVDVVQGRVGAPIVQDVYLW
ncbi:hypothetical protein [Tunturiibacter gelidoferens]|uniref:Uncharacterized protein n=1 Tax=Tunturiibacter gelidiferens TaxID=3069689 RepID=A0ACC5P3E7_9BACT|nr:hypothetical protein [Edaphobacter lichenicola]MBB5341363.1 hypothetical protein [Edaphobacter lichenicola]